MLFPDGWLASFAPIVRLASIHIRPFRIRFLNRRGLEEVGLCGLEIRILDDRGSDENDQVGLLARFAVTAERVAQYRDVAKQRNFRIAVANIVLDKTAQDQRVAAGDHDGSFHFSAVEDVTGVVGAAAFHGDRVEYARDFGDHLQVDAVVGCDARGHVECHAQVGVGD
jgi:hypothetical protein